MKKWVVLGIAVAMVLTLFAGVALTAPQPKEADVKVQATVAQAIWLEIPDNLVELAVDPIVTTTASESIQANVRSNWDWNLSYSGLEMTGVDPDNQQAKLPAGYLTINGDEATADNGSVASGGKTSGTPVDLKYALTAKWDLTPAVYTGSHTYTLTFD